MHPLSGSGERLLAGGAERAEHGVQVGEINDAVVVRPGTALVGAVLRTDGVVVVEGVIPVYVTAKPKKWW